MIEKIQHYSITNQASIFDEEALTALELAGRTAAKINECVEVVNDTVETLPGMVDDEVQEHINNGDFAQQIDKYAGELDNKINSIDARVTKEIHDVNSDLTGRINNLVGMPEGSTTMDAEVIDIRVNAAGHNYPNAGESVRKQVAPLQQAFFTKKKIALTVNTDTLFNIHSGLTESFNNAQYASHTFNGEKIVSISGYTQGWDAYPLFAVYDSEGNRIYKYFPGEYQYIRDYVYVVPSNAAYMIIHGKSYGGEIALYECVVHNAVGSTRNIEMLDASQLANYQNAGTVTMEPYALNADNTEMVANAFVNSNGIWTAHASGEYVTLITRIPKGWKSVLLTNYRIGNYGGGFFDENHTFISAFGTAYPDNLEKKQVPANAAYLYLTAKTATPYADIYVEMDAFKILGMVNTNALNHWEGKKVVWMGTSIPFGTNATTSYVKILENTLNFNLVPAFVPGLAIHTDNGAPRGSGSFCLSKEEYAASGETIAETPVEWVPGGSSNNYYRTYENVFCAENADADIFVFDNLPNNGNWSMADWEAFNPDAWAYKDGSTFSDHRDTFMGAMLFLIDQMYKLNPKARMVLLITSQLNYTPGKPCFDKLAEMFNIAIINTWERMTTTPQALAQTIIDPVNDPHLTNYAHERIGRMLTGEFMKLA